MIPIKYIVILIFHLYYNILPESHKTSKKTNSDKGTSKHKFYQSSQQMLLFQKI